MRSQGLSLLLALGPVWAIAPVLTPGTPPVVQAGATLDFNANQTVTWSMVAGSVGSINSSTGLYTAPATLAMKHVMDGCPMAPNDTVFTTKITALPVHTNSNTWIGSLGSLRVGFEISFPRNKVTNASANEAMSFLYTSANNGNFLIPEGANSLTNSTDFVIPYQIEGGVHTQAVGPLDRHLFTVNQDDCSLQEFYKPYPIGDNPACPLCNGQSGVKYGFGYSLPTQGGTDAASLPILPLIIHYEELRKGVINHALRFTLPNGVLCSSASCGSGAHVWPASANAEAGGGTLPYGALLRLKSSVDISGYSAMAQVILKALKDYGAYMADGGNAYRFQTGTDVMYRTDAMDAFREIFFGNLRSTDFEYVNQAGLKVSDSISVVSPTNGLVTPDGYSWVQACNTSAECTRIAVAVQGVTIGRPSTTLEQPVIAVMAGTPAFQIPVRVHGSANTGFSCTKDIGAGTLTSGGLYTAPPTQADIVQKAEITCSSAADPTAQTKFLLHNYPGDGIRVDMGGRCFLQCFTPAIPYDGSNNYGPDVLGKYWWRDTDSWPRGYPSGVEESYPQASWSTHPDIGLWYTRTYGDQDMVFSMHVPDGNYALRILLGEKADNSPFPPNNRVMTVESQSTVFNKQLDLCTVMSPACRSGYPGEVLQQVAANSNVVYFALRREFENLVFINGFSVLPSDGPSGRSMTTGITLRTGRTR